MPVRPFSMKMTAAGLAVFLFFYLGFYILYYRILLTGLGREEFLSDLGVRELTFNKFIFAVLCISVALMLTGIFGVLKAVIKNAAAICFAGGKIEEETEFKFLLAVPALIAGFRLIFLIPDFYFNNIAQASKEISGAVGAAAVYICGFTAASGLIAAAVRSKLKKTVKISAVFLLGATGLFLIASAVRMLLSV